MSDWDEIEPDTWVQGLKRIYKVDDGFVISYSGAWIPGVYASMEAAIAAFSYTDDEIASLAGKTITLEMLRSLRDIK